VDIRFFGWFQVFRFSQLITHLYFMGRNNDRNIKKHNDKLHKAQDKAKKAAVARREKLSAIVKKYNDNNPAKQ